MGMRMAEDMEQTMGRELRIEDIISIADRFATEHPPLADYFSPTRTQRFMEDYREFLRTMTYRTRQAELGEEGYVAMALSLQFTAPLLGIEASGELRGFCEALSKTYGIREPDLSLRFLGDEPEEGAWDEFSALHAYASQLQDAYKAKRSASHAAQAKVKRDGIEAVMTYQRERTLGALAEAFGRSVVVPAFFEYKDKRLVGFYRSVTEGVRYSLCVPEGL